MVEWVLYPVFYVDVFIHPCTKYDVSLTLKMHQGATWKSLGRDILDMSLQFSLHLFRPKELYH